MERKAIAITSLTVRATFILALLASTKVMGEA
jgi:hypothetical protein